MQCKQTTETRNKAKNWVFENINKIDHPLARTPDRSLSPFILRWQEEETGVDHWGEKAPRPSQCMEVTKWQMERRSSPSEMKLGSSQKRLRMTKKPGFKSWLPWPSHLLSLSLGFPNLKTRRNNTHNHIDNTVITNSSNYIKTAVTIVSTVPPSWHCKIIQWEAHREP